MAKTITTWVLVADGANAAVYANEGPGKGLAPVADMSFTGTRANARDIVSDRGGRESNVPGGPARHGLEPRTDVRQHVEREFVRSVVEALASAESAGRFDRLVVVAAPHALGDLRALLPAALAKRVTAEVAKDYIHLTPKQIADNLADVANF